MTALEVLRYVSAAAWSLPFVLCLPSAFHTVVMGRRVNDGQRGATWFVSTVFIGFGLMWMVFPTPAIPGAQEIAWQGLYVLSSLGALLLTLAVWSDER